MTSAPSPVVGLFVGGAALSELRTDDLIGYERGDRAMPLDRAQAIAVELNVPVSALVCE